tara:strand:- start:398 stop:670 length:273 start_codon:yes stop_codon:yes gene_type:complete
MARKRYHLIIKESCPYCRKAIALLDSKSLVYDLDPMDETPELLTEIKQSLGYNTVPMVWEINHLGAKTFIGGYDQLAHLLEHREKELLRG